MPSLGADMDAGRLLEWYVKPGDAVKRGDIVALVDTDKAAIEVEIFEDGVVGELLVPPGEKVPVGTALATIVAEGEAAAGTSADISAVPEAPIEARIAAPTEPPVAPAAERTATPPAPARAPTQAPAQAPSMAAAGTAPPPEGAATAVAERPPAAASRPHATPAARTHARAQGVDLTAVTGSGRHGVITCQDVEAAAAAREAPATSTEAATPSHEGPEATGRVRASPLARKVAQRLGVDLASVPGTGPGGAITWQDVEAIGGPLPSAPEPRAASREAPVRDVPGEGARPIAPSPTPARKATPAGDERYAAMRRAIAAAMSKSKREIPHYYLDLRIDMSAALAWLEETNLARSVTERLLPAALLLKAAALATRDVPEVNGFYRDDGFEPSESVHLGVGISLRQGGLIAPAIHDADRKDLDTLMADLRDLVKRARSLQLRSSEMTDGTLTATMLGDQGVESVYGIIYPPQVALVGFGRVVERPWAENGMLAVRPTLAVTLAADHRASDGHRGGLYLSAIERRLLHPEEL